MNTKNILILGSTGKGKSTLINVLADKEVAKEGNYSTSTTSKIQAVEVNHNGKNYKLIDTVGFGDTKFTPIEVLEKLVDISEEVKNGITQIFFVFDGKVDKDQAKLYLFLRKILLTGESYKHTTLIRTHFADFENSSECSEDQIRLLEAFRNKEAKEPSEENRQLINLLFLGNDIVHVDNPPLLAHYKEISKEIRGKSRIKLFEHLEKKCNEIYEVNIENLKEKINNYKNEVEELSNEVNELIQKNKDLQENLELTQTQKDQAIKKLKKEKEILIDKLKVFEAEQKEFIIFRRGVGTRIDLLKEERDNKNIIINGIGGENRILQATIEQLEKELQAQKEKAEELNRIIGNFERRRERDQAERGNQEQQFRTEIRELPWNQRNWTD